MLFGFLPQMQFSFTSVNTALLAVCGMVSAIFLWHDSLLLELQCKMVTHFVDKENHYYGPQLEILCLSCPSCNIVFQSLAVR